MRVVIAGHDRLGIVTADLLSEAGHDVLIVEEDGRRIRSFPSHLLARPNVDVLEAKPTQDETMVAMDIRGADLFVAALRTPAENGLAALKAKITYGVDQVVAVVTHEALSTIYKRFGIRTVNPYTLALSDLHDTLNMEVDGDGRIGSVTPR
ncbi:MAG: NAD-binding protein [Chloroflexi bacterium]|nr:NAD-binding protein [Chloroflexota bacterium]